jgi:RNA polymerase sigma factor (sigma-70 family)
MDSSLVVRAQQGDREAFTGIVDAFGGRLHAIAYTVLRDRDLACDATQQTLLTVWQDLAQLRDPDRFEAWACRILVRYCHAENRKASRWMPASSERPGAEPAAPDASAGVIERDRIEHGFRRLNVDQRLVVVMSYYFDLAPAVIADHLGIPVGTVHSRLHRALRVLHAAIDADERAQAGEPSQTATTIQQEATR